MNHRNLRNHICEQCQNEFESRGYKRICTSCGNRRRFILNVFQNIFSEIIKSAKPEDAVLAMVLLRRGLIDINASYHAFQPLAGVKEEYDRILSTLKPTNIDAW